MKEGPIRVLLIEDNAEDALRVRRALTAAGEDACELQTADRLSAGLLKLAEWRADVVLLDLGLPDSAGMDTLTAAMAAAPDVPIVVLTGVEDHEAAVQAVQRGAQDYLVKGQVSAEVLARTLDYAMARAGGQRRQVLQREVLADLNRQRLLDMDALADVLRRVMDRLGIGRAALRLRLGEHWPLHIALGFPDVVREEAEHICSVGPDGEVRRDEQGRLVFDCLCGNVLGDVAVGGPACTTERGTFWSGTMSATIEAIGRASGPAAARTCCTCGGCQSVAIIPLRSEDETIGVLQFANAQAEAFSLETVTLLEDIADSIGTALTRQRAEDALRQYAGRVETMRRVAEAILAAQSVLEISQAVLSPLPDLVPCSGASVVEFDLNAQTAQVLAVYDAQGGGATPVEPGGPDARIALDAFGELEDLRAGQVRLVADLRVTSARTPAVRALLEGGVRSAMMVPLVAEGELIGCLNVGWSEPGTAADEDQAIARELAQVLTVAIGAARSRQRREEAEHALDAVNYQMRVARGIQEALYPAAAPEVPGFDLAGASVPAEAAGGDYFDFVPMPDGFLGIAIGDVTGHGVGAAMLMASMRAYLRAFARTSTDVSEILGRANRAMVADTREEIFCTMLFVRFDPRTGDMVYVNAGHPPAALLAVTDEVRARLTSTAVPLGLVPGAEFPAGPPVTLEPGELAFFCTDGVLDVASGAGSRFGRAHVLEVVRSNRSEPATRIVREVCRAVLQFCEPELPADDITAVVIKAVRPEPPPHRSGP